MLFLVPLAAPVHATNASLPSIAVTGNNPALGGIGAQFTLKVANPSTNQYTVTAVSITMPTGWVATAAVAGGYLPVFQLGGGGSGVTYTVSTFTVGTGAGIPPGSSDILKFTATAATGASYPFTSTFFSQIQDASAVGYYAGPTFSLQVISPATTITVVTPAASANYVAGSAALTETATITPAQAGITVTFTTPGYGATTTYSLPSAVTVVSGATGVATTTFQPSNHAGDATTIMAAIGTSSVAAVASVGTITTINAAPTQMTWAFAPAATNGNHYITTQGTTVNTGTGGTFTGAKADTTITFSLADVFANPVALNSAGLTAYTFTLTALSGGGLFDALGLPSVISCTNGADWKAGAVDLGVLCSNGAGPSYVLPFQYYQSGTYGTIGQLSAAVSGTYSAAAFAGAGQSKSLITSTFAAASPVPVPVVVKGATYTIATVPAGNQVNVTATLGTAQTGVPVTFKLDKVTSFETIAGAKDYGAKSVLTTVFTSGTTSTTLTTNAAGKVFALFTVDTVAGAHAFFNATVLAPTDASSTHSLANSGDSAAPVITVAASPSTFSVLTYYENTLATPASHAATGGTLYFNVIISDQYGNVATNTALTQIQVGLTASCGATCPLSATNVYIAPGQSSTAASFGAIVWTMPSTIGTVTLTASGVLSGVAKTSAPDSIGVVSPLPTLAVTSPKPNNGVIYSSTSSVVFSGNANTSIGYAATGIFAVSIASVTYSIDSGASQPAPISSAYKVTFAVAASFAAGLHTIAFTATDSLGNKLVGQSYQVLVDTTTPTVKFTTANNAQLGYGATVTATIVAAQGDLNFTRVVATNNGTALPAGQVVVSGTNSLGNSVTYTVTISGLPAGHQNLGLSASTYAGLTGTATGILVIVTLPFANSVSFNTASASYATVGAYKGVTITVTNGWNTPQTLVVYATFKSGTSIYVADGTVTLAAGASAPVFCVDLQTIPAGSYSVTFAAVTTSNLAVSAPTTAITLVAT